MLEKTLRLIFCSIYLKTRNDTFWMQNFFFFTGEVLNASHLQSVRSHTGWQNNSKVFSLRSFHCQQWTWQQEHLIVCKTISYSNKCGTHLHAQREGGSSLPRMYRIPISVWAAHTHSWGNRGTIVHTLANWWDPAELLLQHCWVESQGTWCNALRHVHVSLWEPVAGEAVLVVQWGEHLGSLPPQGTHALLPDSPKLCADKGLWHEQAPNQTQCLKQEIAFIAEDLCYRSCLVNECLHNFKLRTFLQSRNLFSTDVC